MMNAMEYLRTLRRMCKSIGSCIECPLGVRGCMGTRERSPEETIEIVESWANEHPIRTRQTMFLEHYPNAEVDPRTGGLIICPRFLNKETTCHDFAEDKSDGCNDCLIKYWLQEVKE